MSSRQKLISLINILLILIITQAHFAQTTGKVTGNIVDAKTGEAMMGANILLEGTSLGAAADLNGDFIIINVPPGKYTLAAKMIGYKTIRVTEVVVSVNRTTDLELEMEESTVEMDEVVVTASTFSTKKDQTASIKNISAGEIEVLPVESIGAVVNMQAGIVRGHFRGGRSGETVTMVDGIEVTDAFRGTMVNLEKEVVQDLEVITGTFNAEYGNAMSGVVNMVTKDGGDRYSVSVVAEHGNFITSHDDIFPGLEASDINRVQDYRVFVAGPIIPNMLSLIANGRYQDNKGHLNYIRRFTPTDYNNYESANPEEWWTESTGDMEYVPSFDRNYNLFGKLSYQPLTDIRTSISVTNEKSESMGYSHSWKYNPDGVSRSYWDSFSAAFQLNHTISNTFFYLAQVSFFNTKWRNSLFEDPLDPGYVHDGYARSTGPGFLTGGQMYGYNKNETNKLIAKIAFTWQINNEHLIKAGFDYSGYQVEVLSSYVRNQYYNDSQLSGEMTIDPETGKLSFVNFLPELAADSILGIENYNHKPYDLAAYIQDKMEFENMVINIGLRFDYYNPNTVYPSNLRNPGNQLYFEDQEKMSTYINTEAQYKISPRFGLSYQLGDAALLRFAYGHFFQRPSFGVFYSNSSFLISPFDYGSTMGNPNLKPEKTVSYEVGLWQEIVPGMGVEVAVFYKDIYDLLTIIPVTTYNQVRYGLYSNKDYGNVRGLELKWDYFTGGFSAGVNYTLQYTKGIADDPYTNFNRAGQQLDEFSIMIPLSWDQRHTFNLSAGYTIEKFGVSMTAYYNSGFPYTWSPLPETRLSEINLHPNNSPMPSTFDIDIRAHYNLWSYKNMNLRLNLLVYNLLDQLNEYSVYSSTGRAYTDIVRETDITEHHSDFNTYYDRIQNPAMYSSPRRVKLGLQFSF
ncbi:MAG: TonB-dependent receptor [Melioribacteraceae bacterium]|nr:TonB-dependent receptor [Melioribacteraceae bacterium]MCF8353658.1 TonB-dependent receptor [Melioribacteraceae bacterium]MCF8393428.1 TonB-dependent receptor [Melioribacteraceae bacterium]MCF8419285.1 TonB-dependent receptor [Melioribacteraceae bacterium]